MSSIIDNLSPKEWEAFCEKMLRHHYGTRNFWSVPDQDSGDLGLEFFTIDGTLFQCYYPEQGVQMASYKSKVKSKINDDLKKLKTNEKQISKLLDDIVINQWVLLTPEFKSKDLISYCNKKKNEVISSQISYINSDFIVKIETASSYPDGKAYALGLHENTINIPLVNTSDIEKEIWKNSNTTFHDNINTKSKKLMGNKSDQFKEMVIEKYIQNEKFLDTLRLEHPDLYMKISDTSMGQLDNVHQNALFSDVDQDFIKEIINDNKKAFKSYSTYISDRNLQSLSFGYLSKWITECFMSFK